MKETTSKENIKLASELFAKCIELSEDEDIFSASLQFTSYVSWFEFDIFGNGGTSSTVHEKCRFGNDRHISAWLNEMLETLIEEKKASNIRNSPENIETTKAEQKAKTIAALEERLVKLKA